jgi:hypothetical protein
VGEDYVAGLKGEGRREKGEERWTVRREKTPDPYYSGVILGVKAGRLG